MSVMGKDGRQREEGFSADEVFQMAERIEQEAARFFLSLAMSSSSPPVAKMLTDLAKMEQDHGKVFSAIREQLSRRGGLPPAGASAAHAGVVRLMCLDAEGYLTAQVTGAEPVEEIVRKAIEFEKTTIVFFLGMRQLLADEAERENIDAILLEELGHVFTLSGYFVPPGRDQDGRQRRVDFRLHGRADGA
jgi:rubrerythrin